MRSSRALRSTAGEGPGKRSGRGGERALEYEDWEFPRFCGVLTACGESRWEDGHRDAEDEACLSGAVPAGGAGAGPAGAVDPGRRGVVGGVAADAAQLAPSGRA